MSPPDHCLVGAPGEVNPAGLSDPDSEGGHIGAWGPHQATNYFQIESTRRGRWGSFGPPFSVVGGGLTLLSLHDTPHKFSS